MNLFCFSFTCKMLRNLLTLYEILNNNNINNDEKYQALWTWYKILGGNMQMWKSMASPITIQTRYPVLEFLLDTGQQHYSHFASSKQFTFSYCPPNPYITHLIPAHWKSSFTAIVDFYGKHKNPERFDRCSPRNQIIFGPCKRLPPFFCFESFSSEIEGPRWKVFLSLWPLTNIVWWDGAERLTLPKYSKFPSTC